MGPRTVSTARVDIRSPADLVQLRAHVVGLGASGRAAIDLLLDHGARVAASDADPALESSAEVQALRARGVEIRLGAGEAGRFADADIIILSPGVPHDQPALQAARGEGIAVIGELELAARLTRTPMVAVTGTNGKTTTTELITAMLAAGGLRVVAGGNIGRPLSSCLRDAETAQWLIVEVSSFQLDTMQTFHPRVAVLLNIAQDHMDRYSDFDAYCASKARILANQEAADTAVVYGADPRVAEICRNRSPALRVFGHADEPNLIEGTLAARILPEGIEIQAPEAAGVLDLDGVALMGRHNRENMAAAALAALAAGGSLAGIRRALIQFKAPPHRMEPVAEVAGIQFVNDSKATNPNAVEKALASFDRPVVLILGGRDKMMDFSTLRIPIQKRVKTLILMGEARNMLKKVLGDVVPTRSAASMEEAVRMAWRSAAAGDVVLLSPACASFDQYANYQARGEDFRRVVATLQG